MLTTTFDKGMLQDSLDFLSPPGTYIRAMNAVVQNRSAMAFGLVNEESNELVVQFPGIIKGHAYIQSRNQTLVFVWTGRSEVWLFDHKTNEKTFVCADKEFGDCNWGFDGCEFLYGEFKEFNGCNELHVYWSSDCIYHVINIDEVLNEKRKQSIVEMDDCTYFDVFTVTCGPHLSAVPAKNGGSTLEGGVVYFAIQLETNEGGVSNVFDVSQPVYLESEDNTVGQISTMSAKLHIQNLDKKWNNVIIYVIHVVGDTTVIKRMRSASYGDEGFTFEYYGQEGEIVDISTIINKSKAWLRGQDMIQKDGVMFYYGIKNERNLNYQKYANNIELEWVEYEVALEQQMKYHFPSLLRGEIYAFAIVWKFADGTYSDAYHIPGIPGLGSEGGSSSSSSGPQARASSDGRSTGSSGGSSAGDDDSIVPGGGSGATGTVATGGDIEIVAGVDDQYNPIQTSQFDTADQYERKRNPTEAKDRKHESDKLEDEFASNTSAIQTNEQSLIDAAECHDTLYGCDEAKTSTENDINDVTGTIASNAELLAGMGIDDPDPDVNTTTNLKDAAVKLIEQAVTNREYTTRKRPVLTYTQQDVANPGTTPGDPEADLQTENVIFTQEGVGQSNVKTPKGKGGTIRGDNWVDGLGNSITEQRPKVVGRGKFLPWESVIEYPDNKDCDGNYFYPQTSQVFHKVPRTAERPHFVSYQNGVVNKYQPDNYEFAKTFVRPIGIKATSIKFPDQDELPKPLCPKSPFKIVYVKRTPENKTIFAKGWLQGIFTGSIYGETQAFPRHGVNSFEHVDRFIAAGSDGFSRKGEQSDAPVYMFHSPDTDADNSYLPITKIFGELGLRGGGWKHGDYAEGEKPLNQFTGKRRDQGGTRISNNLNHYTKQGTEADIVGFSYAPANMVVTKPAGMDYTLNNRYRASAVYLQASARLPGDDRDNSFIGAVLHHFYPLTCNAPYVSLGREVPDLYGSVDGLKYIDLGIVATQVHGQGTMAIEGICGDTWIGPYSKRLTSYVSNKRGNFFNPPAKPGSTCRPRSWCESPEDEIFEYMGIDNYPSKLPKSGDKYDPKNYAGLHTVAGACGEDGRSKSAAQAIAAGVSESDYYGPRTLKGLAMTIVESHVNPALLQTGEGSQIFEGKVYYPKLKDLYLDADAPNKHPWEKSFLTRFYTLMEQPSKSMLTMKAAIRTFINMIIPAELLLNFQNVEAIFDAAATWMVSPMIMAFWVLAANTLFTDKRLNQMLGIGECLRDEEGGDLDEDIQNFEDAYCRYNFDYSRVNDIQPYYAFPLPFNTCDCDECSKEMTNNMIYYSNPQNLDTEIDSYRNVRMNNYSKLPANAGRLKKLFIVNGNLYALCTSGIWALKVVSPQFSEQITSQQSGTGTLLAEPVLLFEGVEGGFAGTNHPNSVKVTPFGAIIVDDVAKRIYRFAGQIPEDISAMGMQNFFKENLGFCDPKGCYDEMTESGNHYAIGFDPRYNRILFTKQDGSEENSFTASYSPIGNDGRWVSFHSYKPQAYLWDRNNFYSILYGKGQIWKHHAKNSYQSFYGKPSEFMVEFTHTDNAGEMFGLESVVLNTKAETVPAGETYPIKDLDITFNKVAIFNTTQGVGEVEIVHKSDDAGKRKSQAETAVQNYSQIKYHKVGRRWNANEIKDLTLDECTYSPRYKSSSPCQVIPEINTAIYHCSTTTKQALGNRLLYDESVTFRYTFSGRTDVQLYLISHEVIKIK